MVVSGMFFEGSYLITSPMFWTKFGMLFAELYGISIDVAHVFAGDPR
jgi:hypothetical protein